MAVRAASANLGLWAASTILFMAAAVLALVALGRPLDIPQASARVAGLPDAPSLSPPTPTDADLSSRLFAARVSAFSRVQAALWRAFEGEPPPISPRRLAVSRVSPGRTPEACLAQAVYYEARGEPAAGQAAVAQVVLNRTRATGRPHSVCGVVFEGAARPGCQFSFACDRRLARAQVDPRAWRRAQTVAQTALSGAGAPELAGAVNYHADYVHPSWAARFARTAAIGRHIFYAAVETLAPPAELRPASGE